MTGFEAFAVKTAERALKTAVQAFLVVWQLGDVSTIRSAAAAAAAAGLSVVTSALSAAVGVKGDPSLLPADKTAALPVSPSDGQ